MCDSLQCGAGKIYVNRDLNAALNIARIFRDWIKNGERPAHMRRSTNPAPASAGSAASAVAPASAASGGPASAPASGAPPAKVWPGLRPTYPRARVLLCKSCQSCQLAVAEGGRVLVLVCVLVCVLVFVEVENRLGSPCLGCPCPCPCCSPCCSPCCCPPCCCPCCCPWLFSHWTLLSVPKRACKWWAPSVGAALWRTCVHP